MELNDYILNADRLNKDDKAVYVLFNLDQSLESLNIFKKRFESLKIGEIEIISNNENINYVATKKDLLNFTQKIYSSSNKFFLVNGYLFSSLINNFKKDFLLIKNLFKIIYIIYTFKDLPTQSILKIRHMSNFNFHEFTISCLDTSNHTVYLFIDTNKIVESALATLYGVFVNNAQIASIPFSDGIEAEAKSKLSQIVI